MATSTTEHVQGGAAPPVSNARRMSLLLLFCLAMFIDGFNLTALFAATPALKAQFDLDESKSTWIISGFQLTYAAFLLASGRICDVYSPKPAFIAGIAGLGLFSLGGALVKNSVGLIILRAFCGVCAALTIPSALSLIVTLFPDPHEQARALGAFGGMGGVANVLGAIISALFVQYANWHWVFYLVTILAIPAAAACLVLIPNAENTSEFSTMTQSEKVKHLDLIGVGTLTVALILFIFGITSGTDAGWSSAEVLAPLIISIFMLVAFFIWEAQIPPAMAAVPPRTWFLPNFAVLFGVSLIPYFWWGTTMNIYFTLWQQVYGWSAINCAVHMIPLGVTVFVASFTGPLAKYVDPKWLILSGNVGMMVATILFALADTADKYWSHVFVGLTIGSTGAMVLYTHANIAVFRTAPATMAGIIGAIFNSGIELGSAVGLAVDASIETSVESRTAGGFETYRGRAATFWWLFAASTVVAIAVIFFYRDAADLSRDAASSDVDFEIDSKLSPSDTIMEVKGDCCETRCGTPLGDGAHKDSEDKHAGRIETA